MGKKEDEYIDPLQVRTEVASQLFHDEDVRAVLSISTAQTKRRGPQKKFKVPKKQFLCVTTQGQRVRIQRIKYAHDTYVIKQTWKLEDLARIEVPENPASATNGENSFGLFFEKPFYCNAPSIALRNEFLTLLWNLCKEKSTRLPQTTVDMDQLGAEPLSKDDISGQFRDLMSNAEETELEDLLKSCVMGVRDIDILSNDLTDRLSTLEEKLQTQNIYSIIDAEMATYEVQQRIEEASVQLDAIDTWLSEYHTSLTSIKSYIEQIESRNNRMEITTQNQRKLQAEIEKMMKKLIISRETTNTLKDPNLGAGVGLNASISACRELMAVYKQHAESTKHMREMKSVQEKMAELHDLQSGFSARLEDYLRDLYNKLVGYLAQKRVEDKSEVTWFCGAHSSAHKTLSPYNPLMIWLFKSDREKFNRLSTLYTTTMGTLYKQEIKEFINQVLKLRIKEYKDRKLSNLTSPVKNEFRPFSVNLGQAASMKPEKMSPELVFAYAMNMCLPTIIEEHKFDKSHFSLQEDETQANDTQTEEFVRKMLNEMLNGLMDGLHHLIQSADKVDPFNDINMLVYTSDFKSKVQNNEYAVDMLNQIDNKIRSLFDKYIEDQVSTVNSTQVGIKRVGILPIISKVIAAVDHMSSRIQGQPEKSTAFQTVDEASGTLVSATFNWLINLDKDQKEKYKLITRFENFHRFYKEIGNMKFRSTDRFYKQAEQLYTSNLDLFVKFLIHRYLQDVTVFFDELDKLLERLPEEDIQFQQSHSKQAFQRVNLKVNPTLINKKMKEIQGMLNKNLNSGEGLQPQVWAVLAEQFVKQYQHYESLVKRCYKMELTMTSKTLNDLMKDRSGG
ncbi:exocyst complex subunit 1 [Planoprotostelium fungivorum]|uniref:Exocyst complex subunit 1 n=1 Tax=Planoprotostelium fungivorum TaxID=1890364 RepID=A0A2P6NS81_9EUKA|nr:exocyst complex subunit 1 [Planoprotostelium fungivorum]